MNTPGHRLQAVFYIYAALLLSACAGGGDDKAYVGYVEADWLYVASPQSGWIIEQTANKGDYVSPNDPLFKLDTELQQAQLLEASSRAEQAKANAADVSEGARPAEIRALQAQLEQAQAELQQAQSDFKRVMPLVEKNIESQARGDQVSANYQRAKAGVAAAQEAINIAKLAGRDNVKEAALAAAKASEAARVASAWQLEQRTIRALKPARVQDTFYQAGEYISAGAPVLALLPDDGLKVRFFVPQSHVASLGLGQSVTVNADGLDKAVSAEISHIADHAEFTPPVIYSVDSREKLVFQIEAKVSGSSGLRPGLPVDVFIASQ